MKRLSRRLLWFSAAGVVCVGLVAPLGCGGESQFSPVTFENRGVRTYDIPYTDVRLWSSPRKPYRKRIIQFWIDEGYLKPETAPTERWDSVTGYVEWDRGSSSGYAKLFWYRAGCNSDEGAEGWIAWSRHHPELAADLWPRVVGLLQKAAHTPHRGECYWVAAALITYVQEAEDTKTYHERLAEWRKNLASELEAVQ